MTPGTPKQSTPKKTRTGSDSDDAGDGADDTEGWRPSRIILAPTKYKERNRIVNDYFNRAKLVDENRYQDVVRFLVGTYSLMAEGLNVTRATKAILIDPHPDEGKRAQAVNRIRRIGQTEHTEAYTLISNKLEEAINDRQKMDRLLLRISKMTDDDNVDFNDPDERKRKAKKNKGKNAGTETIEDSSSHDHSTETESRKKSVEKSGKSTVTRKRVKRLRTNEEMARKGEEDDEYIYSSPDEDSDEHDITVIE